MENKNIITLKRSGMDIHFTNSFYRNQLDDNDSLDNYVVVDVTSRVERNKEFMKEHPNFGKELSPFYIGPVVSSDGVKANIFELFWQCGKVYPCHDNFGKHNKDYFKWRNSFYSMEECNKDLKRHTCKSIGYNHSDVLYFAYFNKEKNEWERLDYVESRKKVYFPEYVKLVYKSESFKWLKSLVENGKKIAILDFDTYNYYSDNGKKKLYNSYLNKCKKLGVTPTVTEDMFLNINSMKDVINVPFWNCGHGFALKALLQGDIEVNENGEIIDKVGLFE